MDIGVHQDGLVHISEMSEKFIRHPLDAVSIGDIVDVKVLDVNMAKRRIALSTVSYTHLAGTAAAAAGPVSADGVGPERLQASGRAPAAYQPGSCSRISMAFAASR